MLLAREGSTTSKAASGECIKLLVPYSAYYKPMRYYKPTPLFSSKFLYSYVVLLVAFVHWSDLVIVYRLVFYYIRLRSTQVQRKALPSLTRLLEKFPNVEELEWVLKVFLFQIGHHKFSCTCSMVKCMSRLKKVEGVIPTLERLKSLRSEVDCVFSVMHYVPIPKADDYRPSVIIQFRCIPFYRGKMRSTNTQFWMFRTILFWMM